MKELIERLRYPVICTLDDRLEAADALERLTAELEATKKAVQQNYFRVVEVTAERNALRVDAKRWSFICDCNNDQALDLLSERVGQRAGLTELVDALVAEIAGEKHD